MIIFYDLNDISLNNESKNHFYNSSLRKYLNITNNNNATLNIRHLDNGKPFVCDNIFVSISHSRNLTIIAFSDYNLGIDTEFIDYNKDFNKIANRIFHESDINLLSNAITNEEKIQLFYNIWCRKEAFTKYVGQNFMLKKQNELDELNYIKLNFTNNVCVKNLNIISNFIISIYCYEFDDIYFLNNNLA